MDFRRVTLPEAVSGQLYLHSMPGAYDPLEECWERVRRLDIQAIICLAPDTEIQRRSPSYAAALRAGEAACAVWRLPMPDFGAPDDEEAFAELVGRAADALRAGHAVLVHCGAGIGRTGTFAIGVLLLLGVSLDAATSRVRQAGSGPETPAQAEALARLARR